MERRIQTHRYRGHNSRRLRAQRQLFLLGRIHQLDSHRRIGNIHRQQDRPRQRSQHLQLILPHQPPLQMRGHIYRQRHHAFQDCAQMRHRSLPNYRRRTKMERRRQGHNLHRRQGGARCRSRHFGQLRPCYRGAWRQARGSQPPQPRRQSHPTIRMVRQERQTYRI